MYGGDLPKHQLFPKSSLSRSSALTNTTADLIDSTQYWQLDSNSIYQKKSVDVFTYDAQRNVSSKISHLFNSMGYDTAYCALYSYDANNSVLSEQFQNYQNGNWFTATENTYTYNGNNNVTSYLNRMADTSGNLIDQFKVLRFYDANQNLIVDSAFYSLNNTWLPWLITVNSYDAQNNIITTLQMGDNSVNLSLTNFYYNTFGKQTTAEFFNWDNSTWVLSGRDTMIFDANQNLLKVVNQVYDGVSFRDLYQTQYSYDQNANIVLCEYSFEDTLNSYLLYRYSYSYIGNELDYSVLIAFAQDPTMVTVTDSIQNFRTPTEIRDLSDGIEVYVYPNPSWSMINIVSTNDLLAAGIVNSSGKLIRQITFNKNSTDINISDLSSGVYFLKIITSKGDKTVSFIKD